MHLAALLHPNSVTHLTILQSSRSLYLFFSYPPLLFPHCISLPSYFLLNNNIFHAILRRHDCNAIQIWRRVWRARSTAPFTNAGSLGWCRRQSSSIPWSACSARQDGHVSVAHLPEGGEWARVVPVCFKAKSFLSLSFFFDGWSFFLNNLAIFLTKNYYIMISPLSFAPRQTGMLQLQQGVTFTT